MKPHKWAKEIKAWADGAEIEWRFNSSSCISTGHVGQWEQVFNENPHWHDIRCEYRIKPQPKEPQYLYAHQGKNQVWFSRHNHSDELNNCIGKIKLEDESE